MKSLRITSVLALTACGVLALSACAVRGGDSPGGSDASAAACSPGITDETVKIGSSMPSSGPLAANAVIGTVAKAVFDQVNDAGGVEMSDGKQRTIEYVIKDDAYDPARTVSNVRALVEEDKVFSLFAIAGTPSNLAVVDYLKTKGVPVLFGSSGSDEWLKMHDAYDTFMGWNVQFDFETGAIAQSILEQKPNAKIGILYSNDGFGKSILAAFQKHFEGTAVEWVAEEAFESGGSSVDPQVATLAASGADVWLNYSSGIFVTQSLKRANELDWHPLTTLIAGASGAKNVLQPAGEGAADGALTVNYLMDPSNPAFAEQEGVKIYKEFVGEIGVDPGDSYATQGYTMAQLMVEALKGAEGCTYDDLMASVTSFEDVRPDLLLPELSINTTPEYPYVLTQIQPVEFVDGWWAPTGDPIVR